MAELHVNTESLGFFKLLKCEVADDVFMVELVSCDEETVELHFPLLVLLSVFVLAEMNNFHSHFFWTIQRGFYDGFQRNFINDSKSSLPNDICAFGCVGGVTVYVQRAQSPLWFVE